MKLDKAMEGIYKGKENLIIIGLTGRTGSGCSTVASILNKNYHNLDLNIEISEYSDMEKLKQATINSYIKDRWVPFTVIELSSIIISYIFEIDSKTGCKSNLLINYLTDLQNRQEGVNFKIESFNVLINDLKGMEYMFKKVQNYPIDNLKILLNDYKDTSKQQEILKEFYEVYINTLKTYRGRLKECLLKYNCYEEKKSKQQDDVPVKYHLYTYILQKIGNNVRASGEPFNSNFKQDAYLAFGQKIELIINLIQYYDKYITKVDKTRICIETIRNPFEACYLKDKFRAFWLLSINVDEETRYKRLPHLDHDELNSLDKVEYPESLSGDEIFFHQNLGYCLELSDIHLLNNNYDNHKYFFLTGQLLKYITLMIHPGLVTPSPIERCMQLAYNAKYNSGCLSRQVGAVITGKDFSVKAVGWNDVPKGQLPCNLRDIDDFCSTKDDNRYSKYERNDKVFQKTMENINKKIYYPDLNGRRFPYCFKDIYNGIKNDKNQVYTRSLHAEENAFLQITKYGGQGIEGGYLFTTASPCELCAKKAYQLGISEIYYIDPYPGISQSHILSFGKGWNPKLSLFYGAIGESYISLYKPILSYKDELNLLTGVNPKQIAKEGFSDLEKQPEALDINYEYNNISLQFVSRENLVSNRDVKLSIINGSYKYIEKYIIWTGSSYDGTFNNLEDSDYKIQNLENTTSPYEHKYRIIFNQEKHPNDVIAYNIRTELKDEAHLMHSYLAHMVKNPIKNMMLKLIVPKNFDAIERVIVNRYADQKMKTIYNGDEKLKVEEHDDELWYILKVQNPLLNYSYCIEWEWKKLVHEVKV